MILNSSDGEPFASNRVYTARIGMSKVMLSLIALILKLIPLCHFSANEFFLKSLILHTFNLKTKNFCLINMALNNEKG